MKTAIIVGAGEGGRLLAAEIDRTKNYQILGFVDDNPALQNKELLGYKILGKMSQIQELISRLTPSEVFIAIPSLRGQGLEKIIEEIEKSGIKAQILPGIFESLSYQTSLKVPAGKLRPLEIGDILERQDINLDIDKISNYLSDKTILITGAGGSIGSELARRISEYGPSKLVLLDNYENNLYELERELNNPNNRYLVVDLKDRSDIDNIFRQYDIEIIFHAAAHKHVPLMEKMPREAIKNNILGTDNLISAAQKYGVKRFVFISTDKAIHPTSIMGATKRFSEEQILSLKTRLPIFAIVRFGNVLGSNGSVIPLWQKQLTRTGKIHVTDPKMKRFFMTIPEAVQLVIQAGAMSEGSNIFVLKMGQQYAITDLAKKFLKVYGVSDWEDKIDYTGIRPAEKLCEILHENNEKILPTSHPMIEEIKNSQSGHRPKIAKTITLFREKINLLSRNEILTNLKKIIPTYEPFEMTIKPQKRNQVIHFSPPAIGEEEKKAVSEVMESGWLTTGKKTIELEKEFAKFHHVNFALAVNSATAGLHLALLSLGVSPGDEVILPSFTFASCANVVCQCGAKPIFVDISKKSFLINPEEIRKKITKKTRAIMVVHYGGQAADMDAILKLSKEKKIPIIEDCAHSPGALYDGRLVGTMGTLGVFSFYPTKNIASAEGGMIITQDEKLAQKIAVLRLHGMSSDAFKRYSKGGSWAYQITEAGFKYNLTDIQAAIALVQLKKLANHNRQRASVAQKYFHFLGDVDELTLPTTLSNRENVWHLFPILVAPEKRDRIIEEMKKFNILPSMHFIPLHLMPYYQKQFNYKKGDLPESEWVGEREISLPMHPRLTSREIEYISQVLKYCLRKKYASDK